MKLDHSQRLGLEAKLLRCPGGGDTDASLEKSPAAQADATLASSLMLPKYSNCRFRGSWQFLIY